MNPGSERWQTISESTFPWEQEALAFVRQHLPEAEPYRAFSNFEFIADDGSINEVDLLVVSPSKVFLVEVKSRPGRLSGDAGTWVWEWDGKRRVDDNPLFLANRKAKKLKALLQKQPSLRKERAPYVDALVFLSAPELQVELEASAAQGLALRTASQGLPGVAEALTRPAERPDGSFYPPRIDAPLSRAIARAMNEAGIRTSNRAKRVGDYQLEKLIFENDFYQDWVAVHVRLENLRRRVRIYPVALGDTPEVRAEKRRAAEREFNLLLGITHPSILKATEFTEHERGPAIFFEHEADSQRLDHFLRSRLDKLDMAARLALVRQIGETLQYAHAQRLYHRTLSPQTILVTHPQKEDFGIKVLDWQTGKRLSDSERTSRLSSDGTMQLGLLADQQSLLYLAPESIAGLGADPIKLDVFSLGAISYHVFSGHEPASSIQELRAKCQAGHGLRISEVLDGASVGLEELIRTSTAPLAADRFDSITELLDKLTEVEAELVQPTAEGTVAPVTATVGDRLEGGFVVKKRLGKGASSMVLLVEQGKKEGVLKVALTPEHNGRLTREAEVLKTLRHSNIVELYDVYDVSGHTALFLAQSGEDTRSLAERLRDDGPLTLDMLQRFGEELLTAVEWLEQNGISHRDIKPDNITIGETRTKRRTLVLFDFSLASTPAKDLHAGTPPYLDPFLHTRKTPSWDLFAERFAAGMTLYEMATGELPVWGDGQSDPGLLGVEATLAAERFDPAVRDGLREFFAKALHSDYTQRFDTAEAMRRAWMRVFEDLDKPVTAHPDDEAGEWQLNLEGLTRRSSLVQLGVPPRILNAMEHLGAHTVGELLAIPRGKLYKAAGIGQKPLRAVREIADRLAEALHEAPVAPVEEATGDESRLSVDALLKKLVDARIDAQDRTVLRAFLGVDGAYTFPSQVEAAEAGFTRQALQDVLERARERWKRAPWLTALRDEIAQLLEAQGALMTGRELALALLASRGSVLPDAERLRMACAVAYAALETEASREEPRYLLYRGRGDVVYAVLVPGVAEPYTATVAARSHYAERLGAKADALAAEDPLLPPNRALASLQEVEGLPGEPPLAPERLLRLAIAASRQAALSSRLEIYPRGMANARALRLGLGSLLGAKKLTPEQVRSRIQSRYPEAQPLPERPLLDALLEQAGLDLRWLEQVQAYVPTSALSRQSSTATLQRFGTSTPATEAEAPEAEEAQALHERLTHAIGQRRYMVLTVLTKRLRYAQDELLRQFPELQVVSLERLLIQALKDVASSRRIDWQVMVRADGAPPDSADWKRLKMVVGWAIPQVKQRLLESENPVLLVNTSLLARYDQIGLLEELRTATDAPGHTAPGFFVLLPTDDQYAAPAIEHKTVPVVTRGEWAYLSEAWLTNQHRVRSVATP